MGPYICFVDFGVVREVALHFEPSRLFACVFEDDIGFVVLKVAQSDEDDVALIDPHFLTHFAADMAQTSLTVETVRFQTAVTEHTHHLQSRRQHNDRSASAPAAEEVRVPARVPVRIPVRQF
jgi:hypothetical protein